MDVPENLYYTKEHEWVGINASVATVGITDYAQGELGDIVFVELPEVGTDVKQMEAFGTIEAVKTVADLYSPMSGEIIEVNSIIEERPEVMNKDPYGEGWIIKVRVADTDELNELLSAEEYKKLIS
ncbi:MAG: glycine cleavage system protein GcvH [Candidatus Glassbacteria bacterium]